MSTIQRRLDRLERGPGELPTELWRDTGDGWATDAQGQRVMVSELERRRAHVILIQEEVIEGGNRETVN